MKARKPIYCYCHEPFDPSPYHPKQTVCLSQECQRRRRREYHRNRIAADSGYEQQCADSQKNWRENHPDYQRCYRRSHDAYAERNRQKQRGRNQKRKLALAKYEKLSIIPP